MVLPSAKNVVNAFFCFVLSPIVAVTKTKLFGQILSKPGPESNILVILFNFCPSLTTSINLYATSTFFMLDNGFATNNLYTCIYYNKHRAISTKQTYISKTDSGTSRVSHIESNKRNFLRNKLLEISSFYKSSRIDKSRKNRNEETK